MDLKFWRHTSIRRQAYVSLVALFISSCIRHERKQQSVCFCACPLKPALVVIMMKQINRKHLHMTKIQYLWHSIIKKEWHAIFALQTLIPGWTCVYKQMHQFEQIDFSGDLNLRCWQDLLFFFCHAAIPMLKIHMVLSHYGNPNMFCLDKSRWSVLGATCRKVNDR